MFPSNVCLLLLLANSDFFFFISPCSLLPVNISSCALLHFTIRSCFQLHFVIYNLLPGYYFSCYLNLSLFEATFSAKCSLKEHPSFSQITRPPKGGLLLMHQLHICHICQTYSNILMVNLINLPWTHIHIAISCNCSELENKEMSWKWCEAVGPAPHITIQCRFVMDLLKWHTVCHLG